MERPTMGHSDSPDRVVHPHDRTVREIMAYPTYLAGESRSILPPELVAQISRRGDLDGLTPAPTEFVDDALGQRTCDLLYYSRIDGETVYYLLLEHQSSSEHWMAVRVLEYAVGIWRRHRKDHPGDRH